MPEEVIGGNHKQSEAISDHKKQSSDAIGGNQEAIRGNQKTITRPREKPG
jgi:hypothetical protein